MITEKEIETLVSAEFPEFKTKVNNLNKSTIVEIRKYLQPLFEEARDKDAEKWLKYTEKLRKEEDRELTIEDRDKYFSKRTASARFFDKLYFVKMLISKRSESWLTRYIKKIKEEHKKQDDLFFAIDIETFDIYSGDTEDKAKERAYDNNPDAFLYIFTTSDKYKNILK